MSFRERKQRFSANSIIGEVMLIIPAMYSLVSQRVVCISRHVPTAAHGPTNQPTNQPTYDEPHHAAVEGASSRTEILQQDTRQRPTNEGGYKSGHVAECHEGALFVIWRYDDRVLVQAGRPHSLADRQQHHEQYVAEQRAIERHGERAHRRNQRAPPVDAHAR